MDRMSGAIGWAALAVALSGCCADPCRPRCSPCAPAAGSAISIAGAAVPAPQPGSPPAVAQVEGRLQVEGVELVLVGPDGKPVRLPEGAVEKGAVRIVILGEGQEGRGKEAAEERHEEEEAPFPPDRGFVGFRPVPVALIPPDLRTELGVTAEHGVIAVGVVPGAPAAQAGLRNGDVLLKYAGEDVPSDQGVGADKPESGMAWGEAFAKIATKVKAGAEVEIVVLREGKPETLRAKAVDFATMRKLVPAEEDEDDEGDDEDEEDEAEEHEGKEPAAGSPAPAPAAPAK